MRSATAAFVLAVGSAVSLGWSAGPAAALDPSAVEEARWQENPRKTRRASKAADPLLVRTQILLDRLRFSPGVIDGRTGDNVRAALRAFEEAEGLPPDGDLDAEVFAKLTESSPGPVLTTYEITRKDLEGPFPKKLPNRLEEMAGLKAMPYRTPREMLAERFHASEALLEALDPRATFATAGEVIRVPAVRGEARKDIVSRLEVDKASRRLRAFDEAGTLVAVYPASIGSDEKPAPTGTHTVRAVARDPVYTYNPEFKFKGVRAKKPFEVPPGPNNPVGAVWIDLSADTYGIHGTPDPEKVGKSYSNGCVRLTNWDALDLATMVRRKAEVTFLD